MNILKCKINTNDYCSKTIATNNQFNNGSIELTVNRIHSFDFDSCNYYFDKSLNILCAIIGYVSNLDYLCKKYAVIETGDVHALAKLFYLNGAKLLSELDGIFTALIWDGLAKKVYIFQDRHGSNLPIYYHNTSTTFICGTSLKHLLLDSKITRELNKSVINDFLFHYNVLPHKSTLIKKILKLTPGSYICINSSPFSVEIRTIIRSDMQFDLEQAKSDLLPSIENNILTLLQHTTSKDINMTLSSGYDTNLMLHYLTKMSINTLNTFTISGKLIDEVPDVKKILSHYSSVKHNVKCISNNILWSFPDIVWRLEGYVFHSGIFLQYELAQSLYNDNKHFLFLGECADQVLDHSRNSIPLRRKLKYSLQTLFLSSYIYNVFDIEPPEIVGQTILSKYCRSKQPIVNYDVALDFILKKNGIMMNSFGIQGIYPFINNRTFAASKALGSLNRKKHFYIQKVTGLLGKELSSHVGKARGGTDTIFMFDAMQEITNLVCYSDFINEILPKKIIAEILKNPCFYNTFILKLLYLKLFNELFISGKFDPYFSNANIGVPLSEF